MGELEWLHLGLNFTLPSEMRNPVFLPCFSLSFSPSIAEHNGLRPVIETPTTWPALVAPMWRQTHQNAVQHSHPSVLSLPLLTCPLHMETGWCTAALRQSQVAAKTFPKLEMPHGLSLVPTGMTQLTWSQCVSRAISSEEKELCKTQQEQICSVKRELLWELRHKSTAVVVMGKETLPWEQVLQGLGLFPGKVKPARHCGCLGNMVESGREEVRLHLSW